MQIVRYKTDTNTSYGALEGGDVVEYSGTPWGPFRRGRRRLPLKHTVLLAPTLPSKIVGVELNHRCSAAAAERTAVTEPRFFMKPTTTLVGPGDPIVYPTLSALVEHGASLAVVIKRRCRNVPAERVREYVLGYTCLNDVTARDLAAKGLWLRAKAFDTFCPLGPCIATDIDPDAVAIETFVNGGLRQSSSTKELIVPVDEVVARVAQVMTLLPGDVVATGTPAGTGPLEPGDRVEVRIEGIGSLKNTVVKL
jgi:2-keto-4-pentenoate hydratase/2-oxohepta-3-ene-1,7-dioic acid hydratase in catechol pathway